MLELFPDVNAFTPLDKSMLLFSVFFFVFSLIYLLYRMNKLDKVEKELFESQAGRKLIGSKDFRLR